MPKPKIMIVIKNLSISMKLGYYLEKNGYDVVSIISEGEKAIDIAKKDNPDLIIIDILLEGKIDGIRTIKQIKSMNNNTSFICISNKAESDIDKDTKLKALATNPHSMIYSPLVFDELFSTIDVALSEKNQTVDLF